MMRLIQRASAFIGWASIASVGGLLIAEATNAIDGSWRTFIADLLDGIAAPTVSRFVATALGFAIALLALAVLVAQLTPYQKTRKFGFVTDRQGDGELSVQSKAIGRAVETILDDLEPVVDASTVVERQKITVKLGVQDESNLAEVDSAARRALDEQLWSNMGMEPRPIGIVYEFRRVAAGQR